MRLSEFDFDLPSELIAQTPAPERSASRLMVVDRAAQTISHTITADLPAHLHSGDLLIVNNTRVIPARLHGVRVPSGGRVECLLLRRIDEALWDALVHPGQKLKPGTRMEFVRGSVRLTADVLAQHTFGRRTIRLVREDSGPGGVDHAIDELGEVPLPPYIHREADEFDRERYQTVYARVRGSVAAPTAGLHLTDDLLRQLETRGVERAEITLHVGYGTFAPVRHEIVTEHRIDPEPFDISVEASAAIEAACAGGRRIIAVGTTTTRTLESVAQAHDGHVPPCSGEASLFIYPGYTFRIVGGLLTNFHLPRSSLLMLVMAFGGVDLIRRAYSEAVKERYRFYSYGDAMIIT